MDFSLRENRKALEGYSTGVEVVTASTRSGQLIGITANSFNSVSLDLTLVSVNLPKTLRSSQELLDLETFAIGFPTKEQSQVSTHFACAISDKWSSIVAQTRQSECPILNAHLAAFQCEQYAIPEAGDHLILMGRVRHFESNEDTAPLMFFRSLYRSVGAPIEAH